MYFNKMIKILIINNENVSAHSLKQIIEQDDDIHVIGCRQSIHEALLFCEKTVPDIILFDLQVSDISVIEATTMIKARHAHVKIFILSSYDQVAYIESAIKNNVDAFLSKTIYPEDLIPCIKSVAIGMKLMDNKMFSPMRLKLKNKSDRNNQLRVKLTARELSVIKLIIEGLSNKEIAKEIILSEGTVRNIVSRLLHKFNVKNRVKLAINAMHLEYD